MLTVFFHPAWYFILFLKFLIALSFTSEGVEWAQERKQTELVFFFCAFCRERGYFVPYFNCPQFFSVVIT